MIKTIPLNNQYKYKPTERLKRKPEKHKSEVSFNDLLNSEKEKLNENKEI